jgi:DNA-binding CsgD family transcriptional regulator
MNEAAATAFSVSPDRRNEVPPIVGRDDQLAVLDGALLSVRSGGSRAVVVAGAPGTGRSALLASAADTARRLGLTVASARAVAGEQHVQLGVAGQLFDALPGGLPSGWRPEAWTEPAGIDRLVGLCTALTRAARRTPLALLVDDVRWADAASETLLRMLLRRLHHAPLAVVVTTLGSWPATPAGALDADDAPPAEGLQLRIGALTDDDVRAACRHICGRAPDAGFTAGLLRLSAGNPRVLVGALTDYSRAGGSPCGPPDATLAGLVAAHRRTQVVAALDTLSPGAVDMVRVLAVADGEIDPGLLTTLYRNRGRPEDSLAELRANGLVPGTGTATVADDVVRERVLAGMSTPARRALHSAVAEVAHRVAAPDAVVSRILLGAYRPSGAWSVDTLRRAAATARDAGRDEEAAALVECALGGRLTVAQRGRLLLDLAGTVVTRRPAAGDRALALAAAAPGGDPDVRARRLRAVDLLIARGNMTMARRVITARLDVLGDTVAEVPADPADLAERDALAALHALAIGAVHPKEPECPRRVPRTDARADDPVTAGALAHRLATRGVDRARATALATAALAPSFDEQPLGVPRLAASVALLLADQDDAAEAGAATLFVESCRQRTKVTAAAALLGQGFFALYRGRVDEAGGHVADARDTLPLHAWHPLARPLVGAAVALVDVARGDLTGADRVLTEVAAEAGAATEFGVAWAYLLFARGALAAETGDRAAAERDLRECGRRLTGRGWHNPLLVPWRPLLARVVAEMGGPEAEVRELLDEERHAAASWGTPGSVGAADLASGLVLGMLDDPGAPGLMAAAERTLRGTPLRLRHTEALLARGAHLVGAGAVRAGTDLLTEARTVAAELGAVPLRDRADRELRAAPAPDGPPHPRSPQDTAGVLAKLSAAEGRVVGLAVTGMSNSEIADTLSVTRRTVELHLSRAYRKLGVSSRTELPGLAVTR